MLVRERWEELEKTILSPYAALSSRTRGRERPEKPCDYRTDYQRDRDRILHCKSFRRLKHKTQVFLSPEGDHYRTRLTHTLEVSQIARTIARALRLNEDLTEAISLGHDLGHTPFGHAGERALNSIMTDGFRHYQQSVRVVDYLENTGAGLNLTYEVRNGILCHTSGTPAQTLVKSIVENSDDDIRMAPDIAACFQRLHDFMYEALYRNPVAKSEESKVDDLIGGLFSYYLQHVDKLPPEYLPILEQDGAERAVGDFIAGMTDNYALESYENLFIPRGWGVKDNHFS